MLLMPLELVQRAVSRLTDPVYASAGVREAAQVLQAGVLAVLHHLKNTGFITDADLERIESEMLS